MLSYTDYKKENTWLIRVVVGSVDRRRCLRRLAPNAKRNAKFLLSPAETGRFIAKTVFPSVRTGAVKPTYMV